MKNKSIVCSLPFDRIEDSLEILGRFSCSTEDNVVLILLGEKINDVIISRRKLMQKVHSLNKIGSISEN